jgi:hypothetical protein
VQGNPGDLFKLPTLPAAMNHNLSSYFKYQNQLPGELKSANLIHFLHSGNPQYHFNSWNHTDAHSHQPGQIYDEYGGWRSLDSLKLHDTAFFIHDDKLHASVYLGGRLLLHKVSADGPVWISTFREVMELTGRWSDVHVKPTFKAVENPMYSPLSA